MSGKQVMVLVGTRKGAFVMESGRERACWKVRGPYLEGQNVMHMAFDPRSDALFAAVGDPWFGSRVYRSTDFGGTWDEPQSGPTFPAETGLTLTKVWHVEPGRPEEPGVVYAGVEPAALFKSSDDGASWEFVQSLNDHPTRSAWEPGGGGLGLHTIVLDPCDLQRAYVAISAAGVFRTTDGGATWETANKGTRVNFMPDEPPTYADFGQCVHKVARDAAKPDTLFLQNHGGIYRSDDNGSTWNDIGKGVPSDFGFPVVAHPRRSQVAYVIPNGDAFNRWTPEAKCRVYRTSDGGASWEGLTRGLPQRDAYITVLRDAFTADGGDPTGLYFGTRSGELYASTDDGDTWELLAEHLPPVLMVRAAVTG